MRKFLDEMLVIDNLPFSFVENPGFRRLMAHTTPRFDVPCRTYFSRTAIPEINKGVLKKIQDLVDQADYISFATDLWTSSGNKAFMSLSGHWIDISYKQKNFLLCMKHFPENHTSEHIKEVIGKMLGDWKIPRDKVHAVVR